MSGHGYYERQPREGWQQEPSWHHGRSEWQDNRLPFNSNGWQQDNFRPGLGNNIGWQQMPRPPVQYHAGTQHEHHQSASFFEKNPPYMGHTETSQNNLYYEKSIPPYTARKPLDDVYDKQGNDSFRGSFYERSSPVYIERGVKPGIVNPVEDSRSNQCGWEERGVRNLSSALAGKSFASITERNDVALEASYRSFPISQQDKLGVVETDGNQHLTQTVCVNNIETKVIDKDFENNGVSSAKKLTLPTSLYRPLAELRREREELQNKSAVAGNVTSDSNFKNITGAQYSNLLDKLTATAEGRRSSPSYDPTLENILQSIGFDFELSKRMQETAEQRRARLEAGNTAEDLIKRSFGIEGSGISSFLSGTGSLGDVNYQSLREALLEAMGGNLDRHQQPDINIYNPLRTEDYLTKKIDSTFVDNDVIERERRDQIRKSFGLDDERTEKDHLYKSENNISLLDRFAPREPEFIKDREMDRDRFGGRHSQVRERSRDCDVRLSKGPKGDHDRDVLPISESKSIRLLPESREADYDTASRSLRELGSKSDRYPGDRHNKMDDNLRHSSGREREAEYVSRRSSERMREPDYERRRSSDRKREPDYDTRRSRGRDADYEKKDNRDQLREYKSEENKSRIRESEGEKEHSRSIKCEPDLHENVNDQIKRTTQQLTEDEYHVRRSVLKGPPVSSARQNLPHASMTGVTGVRVAVSRCDSRRTVLLPDEELEFENRKKLESTSTKPRITASELEEMLRVREERTKRLALLERQLERLRKTQNEMLRRKQREKDGHRDPLILENNALQDEIEEKMKQIRHAVEENNRRIEACQLQLSAVAAGPNKSELHGRAAASCTIEEDSATQKSGVVYEYDDSGGHWCRVCALEFNNINDYFKHVQSDQQHLKMFERQDRPWLSLNQKDQSFKKVKIVKGGTIKGAEFLSFAPHAFFCALCQKFFGDLRLSQQHLSGQQHQEKYNEYLKDNSFYEQTLRIEMKANRLIRQDSSQPQTQKQEKEADIREEKNSFERLVETRSCNSDVDSKGSIRITVSLNKKVDSSSSITSKAQLQQHFVKDLDRGLPPFRPVVQMGKISNSSSRSKNVQQHHKSTQPPPSSSSHSSSKKMKMSSFDVRKGAPLSDEKAALKKLEIGQKRKTIESIPLPLSSSIEPRSGPAQKKQLVVVDEKGGRSPLANARSFTPEREPKIGSMSPPPLDEFLSISTKERHDDDKAEVDMCIYDEVAIS